MKEGSAKHSTPPLRSGLGTVSRGSEQQAIGFKGDRVMKLGIGTYCYMWAIGFKFGDKEAAPARPNGRAGPHGARQSVGRTPDPTWTQPAIGRIERWGTGTAHRPGPGMGHRARAGHARAGDGPSGAPDQAAQTAGRLAPPHNSRSGRQASGSRRHPGISAGDSACSETRAGEGSVWKMAVCPPKSWPGR